MRDLKTLYQLVLQEIELGEQVDGICVFINYLSGNFTITTREWIILKDDFCVRRPKWSSKFFWSPVFNKIPKNNYWWQLNEKGMKQRIKFLKHLINTL